jgi:transposase-like protein
METKQDRLPQTLVEAIRYFSDLDVCTAFVAKMRWSDGPVCDRCGGVESSYISTRRVWKCKACKRQYSVKVGTIFEDSALGLDKWLPAVWLIANSKNGVSSHELGRALGVTQKSAWFMLHRIRLAMASDSLDMFGGTVEVDETYVGGISKNMHAKERKEKITGGGRNAHMTAVIGAIERGGEVVATVIPDASVASLQRFVKENVHRTAVVYTDNHRSYVGLRNYFNHGVVDHGLGEYVNGQIHTNSIENFWSVLKRSIKGTYISVAAEHVYRYVDERVFAFNNRKNTDLNRFSIVLGQVSGRRLTYDELTSKA